MSEPSTETRKRHLGVDPQNIIDGGRTKRRRGPVATPNNTPKTATAASAGPNAGSQPSSEAQADNEDDENEDGAEPENSDDEQQLATDSAKQQLKKQRTNKHAGFALALQAKLTSLTTKLDEDGRPLSTDFIHLPNKKHYPDYYSVIKQPISFDIIGKKLKKKQYANPVDFATDVNLIFSNAFEFNVEDSTIYNSAAALKAYFLELMSDFPGAIAATQTPTPTKINGVAEPSKNGTSNPRARPPVNSNAKNVSAARRAGSRASPSVNTPSVAHTPQNGVHSVSQSPVPEVPPKILKSLSLRVVPTGRAMTLRASDRVRSWSFRLANGMKEKGIEIMHVEFEEDLSESESDDDDDDDDDTEMKEEDGDASLSTKRARKAARQAARVESRPQDSLAVKLNGGKIPPQPSPSSGDTMDLDQQPKRLPLWLLTLITGRNVVEIGEAKGNKWTIYVDRF